MTKANKVAEPKGVLVDTFGDPHCGSTTGLLFPREYQFKDANVRPNPKQRAIWERFVEYGDIVRSRREGRRLVVQVNGDQIDGNHHDTHELVTRKMSEQKNIFQDVFDAHLLQIGYSESAGDRIYFVAGTSPPHGEQEHIDELARHYGAIPYLGPIEGYDETQEDDEEKRKRARDGWFVWPKVELTIYGNLMVTAHHPPAGIGNRSHTKGNGLRGWLRSHLQELDARRMPLPRLMAWSHLHQVGYADVRFDNGKPDGPLCEAFVLPGWQGKTEYVHRRFANALPTAIGALWAEFDPDGSVRAGLEYQEILLERKPEVIA